MKSKNKIPLDTIVTALGKAMQFPIGMNHLAVLIHGWQKKRPDKAPNFSTIRMRKMKDGFAWLKRTEVADLSDYAGYEILENC